MGQDNVMEWLEQANLRIKYQKSYDSAIELIGQDTVVECSEEVKPMFVKFSLNSNVEETKKNAILDI